MQTNTLKAKTKRITSVRIGRGGKRGKTSGRGTKGQKARSGHRMRPEMRDIIKKLPKRRGHGKNRARTVRADRVIYVPVNLAALESAFSAGDTVTPATLFKKGLVTMRAGCIKRKNCARLIPTHWQTRSARAEIFPEALPLPPVWM
ncbi:MAG: uL15 family ribosomal protein [Bacillota bacterium]